MKQFATIIGIDKMPNNVLGYRILVSKVEKKSDGTFNWNFSRAIKDENWVKQNINRVEWSNITLKNGEITGISGSLKRFNNNVNKPIVILSQLVSSDNNVVGYKVVSYDGVVKNLQLNAVIGYCSRITKSNGVPVQNAIYISETADSKAYIKSYPDHPFLNELLASVKENPYVKKANVDIRENKKALNKLDSIFSKAQIKQLKLGKDKGVNFKLYANPNLKPEQMEALRECLENGINIRAFASPEFDADCMRYYGATSCTGVKIDNIVNPKYTIKQLIELTTGQIKGLDISKYADPSLSLTEMRKIKDRLELEAYFETVVKESKRLGIE